MLVSIDIIKRSSERIENAIKKIKDTTKEEEKQFILSKMYAPLYDIMLALNELNFITTESSYEKQLLDIKNIIDILVNEELELSNIKKIGTRAIKICGEVNDDPYEFTEYYKEYNYKYRCKEKYELYSYKFISEIVNNINVNNRSINALFPNCSDGSITRPFYSKGEYSIKKYGYEVDENLLSGAKKIMDKVVKGGLKGSRIKNKAFDVLILNQMFSHDFNNNDMFADKRFERSEIADMFKYLRDDGVMVVIMPIFRLYQDVCSMFARQLKNIQIMKMNDYDFSNLGLIAIVGQKEVSKVQKEAEYTTLRKLFNIDNLKDWDSNVEYRLPTSEIPIDIFKGSALDLEELSNIIENSSLMNKMWEKQKVKKIDEEIKNPLLPFNIGQLGLVLTSGCLDGIVDEGDNNKHLIKGRVTKKKLVEEVKTDDGFEITETTVNKVEIGVMLPNGEFKVLA